MLILGVSVISRQGSLALINEQKKLIGELEISGSDSLSCSLIPKLVYLFNKNKITLNSISCIAMTHGPGSFTSLRVGLAAIKGFFFNQNIPCIGVSSLHALASTVSIEEGIVIPMIDAKKGEIYVGIYKVKKNQVIQIKEDFCIKPDKVMPIIKKFKNPLIIGDGFKKYQELFNFESNIPIKKNTIAYETAKIGYSLFIENKSFKKITLNYCRKSEAEVNKNLSLEI